MGLSISDPMMDPPEKPQMRVVTDNHVFASCGLLTEERVKSMKVPYRRTLTPFYKGHGKGRVKHSFESLFFPLR